MTIYARSLTTALAFLAGALTTTAAYIGGRLLGAAIVRVDRVEWL